jgi:hypothetical protein
MQFRIGRAKRNDLVNQAAMSMPGPGEYKIPEKIVEGP